MQCREVRDLADSFLTEQLLVETNHEVLRHLEGCPACRAELASRRELRAAIRRAFIGDQSLRVSDQFRDRVVSRLRTAIPGRRRLMNSRSWRIGLTVAAALVLAAGVCEFFRTRGINPIVQEAVADHENCAVQFRLPEKPISLEDAAANYDPSFRLLEDAPSDDWNTSLGPLRIVDRHSCVFQGRRFAHVVLQIQGQLVSLLVTANGAEVSKTAQDADGLPRLAELQSESGVHLVSFDVPGHTVFLVGTLGEQELRQVAQSLSVPLYSRFARS